MVSEKLREVKGSDVLASIDKIVEVYGKVSNKVFMHSYVPLLCSLLTEVPDHEPIFIKFMQLESFAYSLFLDNYLAKFLAVFNLDPHRLVAIYAEVLSGKLFKKVSGPPAPQGQVEYIIKFLVLERNISLDLADSEGYSLLDKIGRLMPIYTGFMDISYSQGTSGFVFTIPSLSEIYQQRIWARGVILGNVGSRDIETFMKNKASLPAVLNQFFPPPMTQIILNYNNIHFGFTQFETLQSAKKYLSKDFSGSYIQNGNNSYVGPNEKKQKEIISKPKTAAEKEWELSISKELDSLLEHTDKPTYEIKAALKKLVILRDIFGCLDQLIFVDYRNTKNYSEKFFNYLQQSLKILKEEVYRNLSAEPLDVALEKIARFLQETKTYEKLVIKLASWSVLSELMRYPLFDLLGLDFNEFLQLSQPDRKLAPKSYSTAVLVSSSFVPAINASGSRPLSSDKVEISIAKLLNDIIDLLDAVPLKDSDDYRKFNTEFMHLKSSTAINKIEQLNALKISIENYLAKSAKETVRPP